jgi:hypothetical protein
MSRSTLSPDKIVVQLPEVKLEIVRRPPITSGPQSDKDGHDVERNQSVAATRIVRPPHGTTHSRRSICWSGRGIGIVAWALLSVSLLEVIASQIRISCSCMTKLDACLFESVAPCRIYLVR